MLCRYRAPQIRTWLEDDHRLMDERRFRSGPRRPRRCLARSTHALDRPRLGTPAGQPVQVQQQWMAVLPDGESTRHGQKLLARRLSHTVVDERLAPDGRGLRPDSLTRVPLPSGGLGLEVTSKPRACVAGAGLPLRAVSARDPGMGHNGEYLSLAEECVRCTIWLGRCGRYVRFVATRCVEMPMSCAAFRLLDTDADGKTRTAEVSIGIARRAGTRDPIACDGREAGGSAIRGSQTASPTSPCSGDVARAPLTLRSLRNTNVFA